MRRDARWSPVSPLRAGGALAPPLSRCWAVNQVPSSSGSRATRKVSVAPGPVGGAACLLPSSSFWLEKVVLGVGVVACGVVDMVMGMWE